MVVVLLALVLYRHWLAANWLVLVLFAAPPTAGAPSRVVAGVASWVLYRQRLVLDPRLAPAAG